MGKKIICITVLCVCMFCIAASATVGFEDVGKKHWAKEYIDNMVANGYIKGYPDGKFYPEKLITRAEFATLITTLTKAEISPTESSDFADVTAEDWFLPFVEKAKYYLSGYKRSGGELLYFPNIAAKREDIAVAVVKFKGYEDSVYDTSILRTMYDDYAGISDGIAKYIAIAVEKGLMQGYEDRTFKPQNSITRAEVATLLWKAIQMGDGNKVAAVESVPVYTPVNDSYVPMPVNSTSQILPQTNIDELDAETAPDVTEPNLQISETSDNKSNIIRECIKKHIPMITEEDCILIESKINECLALNNISFDRELPEGFLTGPNYGEEYSVAPEIVSNIYSDVKEKLK